MQPSRRRIWYQWTEEESFIQKVEKHGSNTEAFDELWAQLPKLFWHVFIKDKQATAYNLSKEKTMEDDSNTYSKRTSARTSPANGSTNSKCTFKTKSSGHMHNHCISLSSLPR